MNAQQKFKAAYREVRVAGRGESTTGAGAICGQFAGWIMQDGNLCASSECDESPDGAKPFKGFVFSESFLGKVARGGLRQAALQVFAARLWAAEHPQTSPEERLATQSYDYC